MEWDISSNNLSLSNSLLGTARRTGTTRLVYQAKYRSHRRRTSKRGLQVLGTYQNSTHMDPSDKETGTGSHNNHNRSNNSHADTSRVEKGR